MYSDASETIRFALHDPVDPDTQSIELTSLPRSLSTLRPACGPRNSDVVAVISDIVDRPASDHGGVDERLHSELVGERRTEAEETGDDDVHKRAVVVILPALAIWGPNDFAIAWVAGALLATVWRSGPAAAVAWTGIPRAGAAIHAGGVPGESQQMS